MRASSQDCTAPRSQRIDAIDFWRGVVLCTIFINHIPGNFFEIVTQKNYGFSDSAEAFVFLSGLSLAVAYAPRFRGRQVGQAVGSIARRAVKLYGVHIALSLAGLAIFAAGAMVTEDSTLLDVHGRDLFVDDPAVALVGLLSLGHQIGYFNILPLYVLLLAPAAALLWIGCRRPALMLAVSLSLYAAARMFDLNVPTWPMKGTWFFDPFTWQLMLAMGLCAGLALRREPLIHPWWLVAAAVAMVLLAAISVTDGLGFLPGLEDWTARWADLGKTALGAGRVLHFAAIAYLLSVLDIVGRLRHQRVVFAVFCRLGRNSLSIFALLSLFAAMGQVLTDALGHSLLIDTAVLGSGFAALCGAAALLETRRVAVAAQTAAAYSR